MKEIKIESSNIKSIFYLELTKELYVFFKSGYLYIYYKVDSSIVEELGLSKNKGKFFIENISSKYKYSKTVT